MSLLQDRSLATATRLAQALHVWYREAMPCYRQALQLGLAVESFGNAPQWQAQAAKVRFMKKFTFEILDIYSLPSGHNFQLMK